LILIISACIGIDDCGGLSSGTAIVKTKNNYSSYSYVNYSNGTIWDYYHCAYPVVISDNYLLLGSYGDIAYLTIPIETLCDTITNWDSLNIFLPYLMDTDPFIEIYIDECWAISDNDVDLIRQIIDNGDLEKYFTRIK